MPLTRSELWASLKEAGLTDRPYVQYKTAELQELYDRYLAERPSSIDEGPGPNDPLPAVAQPQRAPEPVTTQAPPQTSTPDTVAGLRTNTHGPDDPIRVDENGLIWYQDEVRKAAFPKPRGRRVLKYNDPGVKTVTVRNGEYLETFEMPGEGVGRPSEARITLPSYQVGIYKDPKLPFKIVTYDGQRGFDLFDVQRFYGGADLVPSDIKRIYVANVLCYDIRTTVRAIETEYRERVLRKEVLR